MEIIRFLKKIGAIDMPNEEIDEYLLLKTIRRFKTGTQDHIVFFVLSDTDKYHDVLLHFLVKALSNGDMRACCLFTLAEELGEKETVRGALERYQIFDYDDRLAIFSWEEAKRQDFEERKSDIRKGRRDRLSKLTPRPEYQWQMWISEISSKVLSYAQNPEDQLKWEEDLENIVRETLRLSGWPDISFSYICTYKWEHLLEEHSKGKLDIGQTVTRMQRCHKKIMALNKYDKLLTGREASDCVSAELAKYGF